MTPDEQLTRDLADLKSRSRTIEAIINHTQNSRENDHEYEQTPQTHTPAPTPHTPITLLLEAQTALRNNATPTTTTLASSAQALLKSAETDRDKRNLSHLIAAGREIEKGDLAFARYMIDTAIAMDRHPFSQM